ncbi:hypothetical protein PZN02_002940 [Sinorhizobium garamanticum]|uniref:Uncharacterized protein n=1 Tax=Sinorhizobium garamanticum TaxID=680247 RepID=A0ABY8D990_9HYPH|nr:hypothetical protein [Sinorhizobium garamanticum]WEX86637.1 hypothetical protein PZN02_002940 [Sinorhizobium garamanticum]
MASDAALYFFTALLMAASGASGYYFGIGFGRQGSKHDLLVYALLSTVSLGTIIYLVEF